jgi:hypothetical protein
MDASSVYGRILAAFGEFHTGIVSATDLVCLIIDKCSGLFHPRPDEVDDKLDHLDVFAVSIGKLVRHIILNRAHFANRRLGKRSDRPGQWFMEPFRGT